MNHCGAPAGKQTATVFDTKRILGSAIIGVKAFSVDVQVTVQMIDVFLEQLHIAQTDQSARAHADDAAHACQQAAVHGHRLRAVFSQVHRMQTVFTAQRVVRTCVAGADRVEVLLVP